MQGQIVKVLSNDYFVKKDNETYICKARGIFRKDNITPKVGDYVIFNLKDKVITEIFPRINDLDRPQVSNITQAFIVTSLKHPDFDDNLLDKLLSICYLNRIKPIICLTKKDLLTKEEQKHLKNIIKYYQKLKIKIVYNTDLKVIKKLLAKETTVFTGQTGSGKSTLINKLDPDLNFETNEISDALNRGKHTTRVTTLVSMYNGKVLDTPGFSSIDLSKYKPNEIRNSFIEFSNYPCPFKDCNHLKETDCEVKKAVQAKKILLSRYENYQKIIGKRS